MHLHGADVRTPGRMAPIAARMVALMSLSAVSSSRAASSVLALRHVSLACAACCSANPRRAPGCAPRGLACVRAWRALALPGPTLPRRRNASARAVRMGSVLLPRSALTRRESRSRGAPNPVQPQPCPAERDQPPALLTGICRALSGRPRPPWPHPFGLVVPQVSAPF